jgi:hypothetical protein
MEQSVHTGVASVVNLDELIAAYKNDPTMTKEKWVRWAVMCAERVLPLFETERPEDGRPRAAIDAAKEWLSNPTYASAAEAAEAAYAAAADAVANAAANAAYAAANAAYAAAEAAYAANTAAYAADAAADAAANAAAKAAAYTAAYNVIRGQMVMDLMNIYHGRTE